MIRVLRTINSSKHLRQQQPWQRRHSRSIGDSRKRKLYRSLSSSGLSLNLSFNNSPCKSSTSNTNSNASARKLWFTPTLNGPHHSRAHPPLHLPRSLWTP